MKIKLSKSQWENIGKTAGWMKKAELSKNIVPVDQIIGTSPTGMTEAQLDADMHSKGYFLFREYYRWGKTLSYRNENDDKVYLERDDSGKMVWMTKDQLIEQVKKTWRPPDREGQDWFVANLGSKPKEENKPIPPQGNFGKNPFV